MTSKYNQIKLPSVTVVVTFLFSNLLSNKLFSSKQTQFITNNENVVSGLGEFWIKLHNITNISMQNKDSNQFFKNLVKVYAREIQTQFEAIPCRGFGEVNHVKLHI